MLSLVEHSLGVRGVGSSNLPVPTIRRIDRHSIKKTHTKGRAHRRSPFRVLEHRPTCQDGVLPVLPAGGAALAQDDSRVSPVLAFAHVEVQDGIPVEAAVVGRAVVPAAPPLFALPAVAAVAEQAGTQGVAAACSGIEFQAESQAVPVAPAAFPVDSSA